MGASILFYSCEDFFDSVTDVDIAAHDSKLAVFCYLDDDNYIHVASVGNSKGYTESDSPDVITDATVTLSKNNVQLSDASVNSQGRYTMDVILNAQTGDEFRLDISAPGYESIYAVERVPPEIDVVSIEYKGENFSQEYGEPLPEYEIVINDDSAYDNYYGIEIWSVDTISGNRFNNYLLSNDFNITEWVYVGVVMNDNTFNGNTYQARVFIDSYEGLPDGYVYEFVIKSISEPMYQYAKSYTNYVINDGNPFAEPVTVTSNMEEEGFGIFAFIRNQRFIVEE